MHAMHVLELCVNFVDEIKENCTEHILHDFLGGEPGPGEVDRALSE